MDVDAFDDIFLPWQTQFDALSDANIEFPVDHSTVEILPDDFLETKEDIAAAACARFPSVNAVPIFPSQITEAASVVPNPKWSASGLQAIPLTSIVDLQPTSIDSSWGSGVTSVSNSRLWGQRGSCVTEETSPPPRACKKELPSAARASRRKIKTHTNSQKHVTQFYSKSLTRLPNREEHILRERKRRDDMAEKFLLLEKLLPPQARRQKVKIVEDTVKLLRRLQLRKDELLKRSAQLKLTLLNRDKLSGRSPQYPSCQSNRDPSHKKSAIYSAQFAASMKPQLMQVPPPPTLDLRKPTLDTVGMAMTMGHSQHYLKFAGATVEHMTPLRVDTSRCRDLLQIHARVSDDEILVEMLFRQNAPNLLARVVQTVETMKLELIRGSMQTSVPCEFVECIITAIESRVECQPRRQDTLQSSATLLVAALQAAFGHVQQP